MNDLALRVALGISGVAAGAIAGAAAQVAFAGDTLAPQGGTCHGHTVGVPTSGIVCRGNYTDRNPNPGVPGVTLNIRDIRDWLDPVTGFDYTSLFEAPAQAAEANWTSAGGPQHLSSQPSFNDGPNYLHARIDPLGMLRPGVLGITYVCNSTYPPNPAPGGGGVAPGPCFDYPRAIDIQWADIYLNFVDLQGAPASSIITTIAHELGHSLGLGHHADSGALMYTFASGYQGPTSEDLGSRTDCRGAAVPQSQWGIRCIYGWYETPTPLPTPTLTAVPTATNTAVPPPPPPPPPPCGKPPC